MPRRIINKNLFYLKMIAVCVSAQKAVSVCCMLLKP